jgi:uncharacterized membrane protein
MDYIKPELLIGVPFLAAIGQFIKSTKTDNRHIPVILGVIGVIFALTFIFVFHVIEDVGQAVFTGIVQGVLIASAAVYGHEISKTLIGKGENAEKTEEGEKSEKEEDLP